MMQRHVKRGEIYYAYMDGCVGSETAGRRPVLIVQNDVGNFWSPTTIVASITTGHKRDIPTHVKIDCLARESTIMLEQLRTIDKSRLLGFVTYVSPDVMASVDNAIKISLSV